MSQHIACHAVGKCDAIHVRVGQSEMARGAGDATAFFISQKNKRPHPKVQPLGSPRSWPERCSGIYTARCVPSQQWQCLAGMLFGRRWPRSDDASVRQCAPL